jgi:hypothetical protein
MTTLHLVLRYTHISMGMVALVSGAAAMSLRKGSPLHARSGTAFFVSMLVMAACGWWISVFIRPVMGNVMGGMLAFYLTATAWLAVRRRPGETGRAEVALALLALASGITGIGAAAVAASSQSHGLHGSPPTFYLVFGAAALTGYLLDVRMLSRGGFTGAARTTRHLSRMCLAMFMATASFFLGQARLFPTGIRNSGVLTIPVLLVIGGFVYFLVRVRVVPWMKRRATRLPAPRTRPTLREECARSSSAS